MASNFSRYGKVVSKEKVRVDGVDYVIALRMNRETVSRRQVGTFSYAATHENPEVIERGESLEACLAAAIAKLKETVRIEWIPMLCVEVDTDETNGSYRDRHEVRNARLQIRVIAYERAAIAGQPCYRERGNTWVHQGMEGPSTGANIHDTPENRATLIQVVAGLELLGKRIANLLDQHNLAVTLANTTQLALPAPSPSSAVIDKRACNQCGVLAADYHAWPLSDSRCPEHNTCELCDGRLEDPDGN